VERISASKGFQNSDRMIRFLRFVVEKTLAGEAGEIKEYTLGVEVFDRDPSFDPKTDTIVRVEARRFRRKLKEYYESEGADSAVRIDVPGPGYAPVFTSAPVAPVTAATPRKWKPAAAVLLLILAAAAGLSLYRLAGHGGADFSSIAVLPFSNMSSDASQEYFCDGFTEELISQLAGIENLHVVARTSVFEFKGKPQDVREIGRRLSVEALVEGSVRRQGDALRITAQLIRTSDGYHLWSHSWDRQAKDLIALQDEVAQAIAETLRRRLQPHAREPVNLEAYDLYLLGRYHWNRHEPAEYQKAIGYFEQAIAKDPKSALAYSGLSEVYSYMIDLDMAPTLQVAAKARDAADRALALNEGLAEAHTSRGLVAHEADWDPARAEREFRRAIELKPSFAYGIHWYAHFLDSQGKKAEAEREMRRAMAIDPLSRMLHIDVATLAWARRDFAASRREMERARELDPDYVLLDLGDGVLAMAAGDFAKAAATFRRAKDRTGGIPLFTALLGQAAALAGDTSSARRELAALSQAAREGYVPAYCFALVYYALGDREHGMTWLRRAFDDRSGTVHFLKDTPAMDLVRKDPAAAALLDRFGVSGR
jgi:serine/threonine-protein kinase